MPRKGFFEKIKTADKQTEGIELWFGNNRSFDERKRDKRLGIVKHVLIENKGFDAKHVRIDWDRGFVKVRGTKMASVSDTADCDLANEVQDIKPKVDELMKAWLAKRGAEE